MKRAILTREDRDASRFGVFGACKLGIGVAALAALSGCVQVTAPERPIEINLNINIRQEVVVRLQQDVQELIRQNPGVF